LACPSHTIEFCSFGAKTGQAPLSFDLVNFTGQHCLFARFGAAINPLTIELHDAYPSVRIKVGIVATFTYIVLRLLDGLNRSLRRRNAGQIFFFLLRPLRRQFEVLENTADSDSLPAATR
jgi:hypothetical protein